MLAFILAASLAAAPAQPADQAQASRLSFLVGRWTGTFHGNAIEETWGPFEGLSTVGMFRVTSAKGEIRFLELMTLTPRGDTFELRLRHFDGGMKPKETEPMLFTLKRVDHTTAVFESASKERITYRRQEKALSITIEKAGKDAGPPEVSTFDFVLAP